MQLPSSSPTSTNYGQLLQREHSTVPSSTHLPSHASANHRDNRTPTSSTPVVTHVTRSGRAVRTPSRYLEANVAVANYDGTNELIHQETHPLVAYAASSNPDILTLNEAMVAPDAHQFRQAMLKEVRAHEERHHWEIIPKTQVPKDAIVVPSVWAMRRKRKIQTGEVYKWKARLNVGGHRQRKGIDYDLTYSPVIAWPVVRLYLSYFLTQGWITRQLDFVLAYPHALVERPTYIALPSGFHFEGNRTQHVLRVIRNLYGSKNAGRTWFLHCRNYLVSLGFVQSNIDPCVFYYPDAILLIFVDDVILGASSQQVIDDVLELLKDNVDVDDQGDLCDYLGVHIQSVQGGLHLSQPHLIQSILQDLRLNQDSKSHLTPAMSSKILHADLDGIAHDESFNYRSVIGKLNYLEKSTRPDIAYAVHQCARFMARPMKSHAQAVRRIGRYLLATANKGYYIRPDLNRSFDCYVDASFSGEWSNLLRNQDVTDPNSARSRTGYYITFANVPLLWASKLQTEIALSSTEAELIALSAATRENIFFLRLIDDAKSHGHNLNMSKAVLHCKVFEDNQSTIAIAQEPRIRPRTKHINIRFWHFVRFIKAKLMTIEWIKTDEQIADILTKPLAVELFRKFSHKLCGWESPH